MRNPRMAVMSASVSRFVARPRVVTLMRPCSAALLVVALAACAQPPASPPPPSQPSPAIITKTCAGPTRAVRVLRNAAGVIGAYVAVPAILDSPIYYNDAKGEPLTMFHIFGPDQEKVRSSAIVKQLTADFPREEIVPCPGLLK